MVLCRFYSREKGWNADKTISRIKYFNSESFEVSDEDFKIIEGLTGAEILKLNLLNKIAKKYKNWYLYLHNIDIGCYTLI